MENAASYAGNDWENAVVRYFRTETKDERAKAAYKRIDRLRGVLLPEVQVVDDYEYGKGGHNVSSYATDVAFGTIDNELRDITKEDYDTFGITWWYNRACERESLKKPLPLGVRDF